MVKLCKFPSYLSVREQTLAKMIRLTDKLVIKCSYTILQFLRQKNVGTLTLIYCSGRFLGCFFRFSKLFVACMPACTQPQPVTCCSLFLSFLPSIRYQVHKHHSNMHHHLIIIIKSHSIIGYQKSNCKQSCCYT